MKWTYKLDRCVAFIVLMLSCDSSALASESVLFIAGQSREEFASYVNHVCDQGKACPLPAGAAFYTSLSLSGMDGPHANALGDNHQDLWFLLNVYQPLSIQVGLWLGADQLVGISRGEYDNEIAQMATHFGDLKRPVFLRIGYEFDGPHNRYPPEQYIQAYRAIADKMRNYSNIVLVWHSFALKPSYQSRPVMEWYPGDDYVDWLAVSFFQVDHEGYFKEPNRERILQIAIDHKKPVMIAEASAIRYTAKQQTLHGQAYWDYWYQPFFDFIESTPLIKAVSMINVNWDSQQQHKVLGWGDSQIHSDKIVLKNWRKKMNALNWTKGGETLYHDIFKLVE